MEKHYPRVLSGGAEIGRFINSNVELGLTRSKLLRRSSLQCPRIPIAGPLLHPIEVMGGQPRHETRSNYRQLYVHWGSVGGHQ